MPERPKFGADNPAREDSEENDAIMPSKGGGAEDLWRLVQLVQNEVIRLGKNVRSDIAEIRSEFRAGLTDLRKDNDARSQEIVTLRLQVNQLPTAERVRELEDRISEARDTAAEVHRIALWVDGNATVSGAADRLEEIRRWQSWILGGLAALGGLGAIFLVLLGAWVPGYLDRREKEHEAAVRAMITAPATNRPERHPEP